MTPNAAPNEFSLPPKAGSENGPSKMTPGFSCLARHFSPVFWGLIVVIFDFSINRIDLLADGLGYLLVAAGCQGLAHLSTRFGVARNLSVALALLWLINLGNGGEFVLPLGLLLVICDIGMVWSLLGGIRDFALSRQREDLAERARTARITYVVVMMVAAFGVSLTAGSPEAGIVAFVLVIGYTIVIITILRLIHQVKVELASSS